MTRCLSSHLTSFASGFLPTLNTISFEFIIARAGFTDNVTIYMSLIVTALIFLVLVVWARFKDKNDLKKVSCGQRIKVIVSVGDGEERRKYEGDDKESRVIMSDGEESRVNEGNGEEKKTNEGNIEQRKMNQDILLSTIATNITHFPLMSICEHTVKILNV